MNTRVRIRTCPSYTTLDIHTKKSLFQSVKSPKQNILTEWNMSASDYKKFCTRAKDSAVANLLKISSVSSSDSLVDGKTDLWSHINFMTARSPELYANSQPTCEWILAAHTVGTPLPFYWQTICTPMCAIVNVSWTVEAASRWCLFEYMP